MNQDHKYPEPQQVYQGQTQPGVGYPHLPPPYQPVPEQMPIPGPPVTVIQAPVVMAPIVGPEPCGIICPSCRAQIVTRVNRSASTRTHMIALLMCLFGCWPCCLIPYCMDSCQSAEHYCPNCNAYIGAYSN